MEIIRWQMSFKPRPVSRGVQCVHSGTAPRDGADHADVLVPTPGGREARPGVHKVFNNECEMINVPHLESFGL